MRFIFLLSLLLSVMLTAQNPVVTSLGPDGGVISVLNGSLTDDVVLAVEKGYGLLRSTDGGGSWSKVTNASLQIQGLEIRDIVFHPSNSSEILLATSSGLFQSTDKGITFSQVTSFPSPQNSVHYSPADPSIIFGTDVNGVLKSTDGGTTWQPLKDNQYFGNRYVNRIAVHPADTGNSIRLLVSTGFDDSLALFFSSNSGATWRPFNKGLPAGEARKVYQVEIDSTGIGKKNFRAVIGTASGIYGAQTDFFDTAWTSLSNNTSAASGVITGGTLVYDKLDTTAALNDQHKFSFYYTSNASDYNGTPRPFSTNNGVFKIGSKYNSILPISIFEPPPVNRVFSELGDIISLFIPYRKSKAKIYLGTTNGIYISTDDGATWKQKNIGIRHTTIRNVVSVPSLVGTPLLFAGIFGGGVIKSTNLGVTWTPSNVGLTSAYVTSLATDEEGKILYAGSSYTLFRSTNRGLSWSELFKVDSTVVLHKNRFSNRENEITVRVSPLNSSLLLFNSQALGLRLSTDGGGTWMPVTYPPANDTVSIPENIEFDPVDTSTIYYAGYGIFRSTNLGGTWNSITSNLPLKAFNPVTQTTSNIAALSPTVNPGNTKEIFLSTTYYDEKGFPFRLFKTTNGGTSWDSLAYPIASYDVIFDRFDPKRILASGPGGIFGSPDGGLNWKRFTDSLSVIQYFLLGHQFANTNVVYAGSDQGVYKIEMMDYSDLSFDTLFYDFGSIITGRDSVRNILFRNSAGKRSVVLQYTGLTDTTTFSYTGQKEFEIAIGGQVSVPIVFRPKVFGEKNAVLKFKTSDPDYPELSILLRGHGYSVYPFERFSFECGSVAVGKDTLLSIAIPNQSRNKIIVTLLENADTVNFAIMSNPVLSIDTGSTGAIAIRFQPKSSGDKKTIVRFSTSDSRFPIVQLTFTGSGIAKNYLTRKIVIDTSFGIFIDDSVLVSVQYGLLRASLSKANLSVVVQKPFYYSTNNSVAIIQPQQPIVDARKDSLLQFVAGGGTLVLLADHRNSAATIFNDFLGDTAWTVKFGAKTGIRFSSSMLIDSTNAHEGIDGLIVALPVRKDKYTLRADSVVFNYCSSLMVDTMLQNVASLFSTFSNSLYSKNIAGIVSKVSQPAVVSAVSEIGKGRIIAIAGPDVWQNGVPGDTTRPYGIFGGKNLQFALNVFGSIENILAQLRETIEERYELISIPYTFQDSSILALFRDLGDYNSYLWRMFGKYSRKDGYKEFPKDFTRIVRGEGYWLITKEKKKVSLGSTSISGNEEDFEIKVNPGYTMIGNPFPYRVSWKNSAREDSVEKVLWSYNSGVYDTTSTVMEPFKGYWVFNRGSRPKIIRINSTPVTTTESIPKKGFGFVSQFPSEWKMQVSLSSKEKSDPLNFIGVLKTAKDGWDDDDFVKPPVSPSDYVSLSFKNMNENLSADYRTINNEGQSWDFTAISSKPNEPMHIKTELGGDFPPHFQFFLLDLKSERMYNLKSLTEYDFVLQKNENSRQFRIVAGTDKFLEKNSNGIPVIPVEYSLSQNFPNPFNPETTIKYSISNSSNVTLEIFNILGQKVRTLVNKYQGIGSYSITWNGKDNNGILVASGIYYYQIHANNFRSVKKMTFIK